MSADSGPTTGLDSFWEDADREESGEHPLERELGDRLDALARYGSQLADAQVNGWDEAVRRLLEQQDREADIVDRLKHEIRRLRDGGKAA